MRNIRLCILLFSVIIISSCQNDANYYNNEAFVSEDEATEVVDVSIKVPVNFDPKTPMSDELRNMNLHDMVVEKYYSFDNPQNRRKHKQVLYKRVNSDGVIDLTTGGPMSYEESWEFIEKRGGHSLSDYFYDAAYCDKWNNLSYTLNNEQFKHVDESSNLAKVYFIDNFAGFVQNNKDYCDRIIQKIEDEKKDNQLREIQEHQKEYE